MNTSNQIRIGVLSTVLFIASWLLVISLKVEAAIISKPPANLGLVGYWSMDEGSGSYATDSSGNKNTGTLTNGPTWVDGKRGKALNFDGVNDYVGVANNGSLQLATALTVSVWFKTSDTTTDKGIIRKDTLIGTRYLYGIVLNNIAGTGKVYGQYYNGTNFQVASTNAVNDGNWHQAIMTISGTTLTFYIDGASQGTAVISGTQGVPTGELDIGVLPPFTAGGRDGFINSRIDEVRIYNRALSASEVQALYNSR